MTTTKRIYEGHGSNFNISAPERRVNKLYDEPVPTATSSTTKGTVRPSAEENSKAQALASDVAPSEPKGVSFARPSTEELADVGVSSDDREEGGDAPEKPGSERRKERADAFRRAAEIERKAQATQKEANAMLAQAKQFQDFIEKAKTDPTLLAKAMGMDQNELLRKYQNKLFEIGEDEPVVKPEEEVKQRLAQYEAERQQERRRAADIESQNTRNTYISSKIIPEISNDLDKYQLLNLNGKAACAGFIYDIMNSHFQQTGEEMSVAEVAEEMENQLAQDIESKIAQVRKVAKFAKHFRDEQEEQAHVPARTLARGSSRTVSSENLGPAPGNLGGKPGKALTREERLNRVINKFGK